MRRGIHPNRPQLRTTKRAHLDQTYGPRIPQPRRQARCSLDLYRPLVPGPAVHRCDDQDRRNHRVGRVEVRRSPAGPEQGCAFAAAVG